MTTFILLFGLSFLVILLVVGAMGIGVLSGREPIRGSCGGLNNGRCGVCGRDAAERGCEADR